ncbi:hypothetical protein V5P93_005268 [Actinokineospora auranticolor]|uniref:hypothetical protein n=1 Tax=Actinokineospora auranticolor TaxID=155976 RepID=UPI000CEBBDEE|nr:hypothetical protein [Actinokineospora auranticolor]
MPAPLWRGLDHGPALVVLVPSASRPRELPAAWQPVAQRFQIAWCAVPTADPEARLDRVEDVLETLADRNTRTQVVAHTALTAVACRVVAEFPGIVRGLVLVGSGREPGPTGVRVRRVPAADPGDLSSPALVREIHAAVERADAAAGARLRLAGVAVPGPTGEIALGRVRLDLARG